MVLTWTDVKEDGKPIADGKYTLERLPENERRSEIVIPLVVVNGQAAFGLWIMSLARWITLGKRLGI